MTPEILALLDDDPLFDGDPSSVPPTPPEAFSKFCTQTSLDVLKTHTRFGHALEFPEAIFALSDRQKKILDRILDKDQIKYFMSAFFTKPKCIMDVGQSLADWNSKILFFMVCVELDPSNPFFANTYAYYVKKCYKKDLYDSAFEALRAFLDTSEDIKGNPKCVNSFVSLVIRSGRRQLINTSLQILQPHIRENPKSANTYANLALTFKLEQLYENVLGCLENFLFNSLCLNSYGQLVLVLGRGDLAGDVILRLQQFREDPDCEDAYWALINRFYR